MHMLIREDLSSAELESVRFSENPITVIRGMESPRRAVDGRRGTREGPKPACVRASLLEGTRGERGRVNVLPWYRQVGVAEHFQ